MNKGIKLISIIFVGFLLLSACSEGTAQEDASKYPEENIEIVVGWGAGGGSDSFTRAIAKEMSKELDTNINVVNKEGSSGAIAGDYILKQPADGYTIWAVSSNFPINIADNKTEHNLDEYTAIGRVQSDVMALQTKSGEYDNYDDFIKYAEENPGEISVGGTGARGFDELVMRQFEKEANVEFNYVSYEDAGEMHADVLGGHIDAMMDEIGPTISQLDNGELDLMLLFNDEEVEGFEDTPLSVDNDIDVIDGQGRGLVVNSDVPDEIVEKLERALEKSKDQEEYLEYEKDNYLHLREGWLDSDDYQKQLEEDIETYKQILSDID